jgi:hypothetical protein
MIYSFINLYILYINGNEKRIKNDSIIDKLYLCILFRGIRWNSHGTQQKLHILKGYIIFKAGV